MAEELEKLPMDGIEQAAPAPDPQPTETSEQRADRERDESGRFAPRGKPDQEAARRREAAERDDWKRKYEETHTNFEKLNKRFEDMSSFLKGEDPNAAPADPLAPLKEQLSSIDQRLSQNDQQRQQEAEWNQVRSFADQDEARFVQQQPDFPDAVGHYINSRLTEMKALGLPQEQAEQILAQEAQQLLLESARARRSPAQTIYAMAQARGYQPGAAPMRNITPAPANANANGGRPAGGRSLGTGGGPAGGALTADQIARMDEADYNQFRSTPEGRLAIKRAMGG